MIYKVIIAGSRNFNDYNLLREKMDFYLSNRFGVQSIQIVSGTARGADRLGERYANERNLDIKRFPANWELHGRAAGYIRNKQMIEYADACVVFWDGSSRGTESTINLAKQYNLPLRIVLYR